MTFNKITTKNKEMNKTIDQLKLDKKSLKKNFAKKNAPFKEGNVIEIHGVCGVILELYVEVNSFIPTYSGQWVKLKKNGEKYTYTTHLYSFDYKDAKFICSSYEEYLTLHINDKTNNKQ